MNPISHFLDLLRGQLFEFNHGTMTFSGCPRTWDNGAAATRVETLRVSNASGRKLLVDLPYVTQRGKCAAETSGTWPAILRLIHLPIRLQPSNSRLDELRTGGVPPSVYAHSLRISSLAGIFISPIVEHRVRCLAKPFFIPSQILNCGG